MSSTQSSPKWGPTKIHGIGGWCCVTLLFAEISEVSESVPTQDQWMRVRQELMCILYIFIWYGSMDEGWAGWWHVIYTIGLVVVSKFQIFVYFQPEEMIQFDSYFSDWLKPPTSWGMIRSTYRTISIPSDPSSPWQVFSRNFSSHVSRSISRRMQRWQFCLLIQSSPLDQPPDER